MPVWLQSMRSPIDINKMAFDFTPEGSPPESGVYAIRSPDGIESLESLTRRLSIGEAMIPRPPLVAVRPPAVHRPGSSCSISSNSSETTVVPPIHNKNYQESRYKTELCRHWEEKGTCPHGTQCLFAHSLVELRAFRGRHKKFKTQMCKAFHTTGFCSFGTRCSYIHEGRDVIPLLVQKYGYGVLEYLPADNEALLRFVNANPEMLSTNEFQTIAKVQMTARVETVTKAQITEPRLPTLTTGTSPVKSQSPPRLSVFSKICNN